MPAAHIHECDSCNGYWPCEAYPCDEPQFSVCEACKRTKEEREARAEDAWDDRPSRGQRP